MKRLYDSSIEKCKQRFSKSSLKKDDEYSSMLNSDSKKYPFKKGFDELCSYSFNSFLKKEAKLNGLKSSTSQPILHNIKEAELKVDANLIPNTTSNAIYDSSQILLNSADQKAKPLAKSLYNTQIGFNSKNKFIDSANPSKTYRAKNSYYDGVHKTVYTEQRVNQEGYLQKPSFYHTYKNKKQLIETIESVDEFLKRKEIFG